MPDTERAQRLLALFISRESAEGIAGDLAEGGDSALFWHHVFATMFTLWGSTVSSGPLAILGLLAVGLFLFLSSAIGGFGAIRLIPSIGPEASLLVLATVWWSGALLTGALLVGIARVRGLAACVVLAVFAEPLLMLFWVMVQIPSSPAAGFFFYPIAALAPLPLLAGGAIVRLRFGGRGTRTVKRGL